LADLLMEYHTNGWWWCITDSDVVKAKISRPRPRPGPARPRPRPGPSRPRPRPGPSRPKPTPGPSRPRPSSMVVTPGECNALATYFRMLR